MATDARYRGSVGPIVVASAATRSAFLVTKNAAVAWEAVVTSVRRLVMVGVAAVEPCRDDGALPDMAAV